jgi:hypothetical protein
MWGMAALYLIMTIGIWSATLRTLGLSSIRRCPRLARLAFRASPIRELSGVLLLPLVAIPLIKAQGIGGQYVATFPLNALLLIALLCFTLFLVPPTTLVFSSSTDKQLRWALSLKRFIGGRRVISLLDTGYMTIKPSVSGIWSIMLRRSGSLTDVLRMSDTDNWQAGVIELIEISPIVIVDTRVCTQALMFEASTVLTPQYAYKAIFVSDENGACPVLERLLDEGKVSSDHLVSVVKEDALGPLLQRLVTSRDALPKPGGFAAAPSKIEELTGRLRDLRQQTMSRSMTSSPQASQVSIFSVPKIRKSLSTPLTPFWRLWAKGIIVQVLLSAAWGVWIMLTSPQLISTSFAMFVLWSLLACYWGFCALYFYLARSLKKVWIEGDSLFVAEYSKECEIHISHISHVTGPDWTTLRRITIHLHQPSAFGKKIVFAGKVFSAGMIARDLRRRLYSHAEEKGKANAL